MDIAERGPRVATPVTGAPRPDRRIGAILVSEGKLGEADVAEVLRTQQSDGQRFGETAVRLNLITREDLRRAIAQQYDVPHLLPDGRRVSPELAVASDPFHRPAEQVRALRTQLLMRWSTDGIRRRQLAIVSPGSGEGRSYLAANLATAFAQLGDRTLLIDCDLRRPRQHDIFDVPDRVGLSAVLSGRADLSAVVPLPGLGRLWLLPAGAQPPNPLELLSRDTFEALLGELQAEFDVVLFDTPPARQYADAQIVAFRAGCALVVARKDCTRLADTAGVIGDMTGMGIRTIGTVFNQP